MPALNLRRVNNALLTLIILINLYVIVAPFAPSILFWWQQHFTHRQQALSQVIQKPTKPSPDGVSQPSAAQNTLVVPAMVLQTPIYEGAVRNEYAILDKGVWRWPYGSTPDKGGNTVLVGHRFTYTNPRGIFYELNKVAVNDPVAIFWQGTEYIYSVVSSTEVPPNDTGILNATAQSQITLYTCTPTWNPKDRLVVVARLVSTRRLQTT